MRRMLTRMIRHVISYQELTHVRPSSSLSQISFQEQTFKHIWKVKEESTSRFNWLECTTREPELKLDLKG